MGADSADDRSMEDDERQTNQGDDQGDRVQRPEDGENLEKGDRNSQGNHADDDGHVVEDLNTGEFLVEGQFLVVETNR